MKKYFPSYYRYFRCLADKCPDSCCAKWEIVIDNDTVTKYKKCKNEIAEKIRYYLNINEDGETCFILKDNKCPFLNDSGLCDIHINLGEEYTSKICQNHPRFIEEYDGFTEISLSLSCPETVNILFESELSTVNYPTPDYSGDDEILKLLIQSRKKLLDFNGSFADFENFILDEAADIQFEIDLSYIPDHPSISISFIRDYLDMLLNRCEILDNSWKIILKNSINCDITTEQLRTYITSNNSKLMKLSKYFIYRYYLKAINDCDLYSRALFVVMSCVTICFIALSNSIALEEAARCYSKETEHNLDNIDALLDYFFDL